ncbi:bacteriohopanetetrol glucosamine biosynthesis glycosyltransferase HpnI [Phaeospirillum tilakii]|uniref:Bacteriohopanetetrol glucosamine biosynthesis glycosyltransferase HpnI n=1 Tax=Phaeospirillum tilakii TaxID=741673 RepID=A0ABW5C947_9PROT
MFLASLVGGAFAVGGYAYLALAFRQLRSVQPPGPPPSWRPPVSVLVPAHGTPPRLEECLRSICAQDYPGLQVVFGLHSADDPARPVIERVRADFPALDTALVIDERRLGSNPKNANLANMLPAAKHDILAMIDSDVLLEPDFIARFIQPLSEPGVGGVTSLYSGAPEPNAVAEIGALYHNDWFIPSVLVDLSRHDMDICYGAAIAVTRQSLAAIGGFEAMADAVAQDYVFGHQLYRHGFKVRLAQPVVATVVTETRLRDLIQHELRWSRAVRAIRPLEHFGCIFMSPLGPMLLATLFGWTLWVALPALAVQIGLRQHLHRRLRRLYPSLPPAKPWQIVARELLNGLVIGLAMFGRRVRWNNQVMVTNHGLSMKRVG